MSGLSVSDLIQVSVSLTQAGALGLGFNTLCIAGDSNVIDGLQRIRSYPNLQAVGGDFGITTPEYLASALYFSQSPTPSSLMIGRWLEAATAGLNRGGILNSTQQALSNWTDISSGGFSIVIDGVTVNLLGLNFDAVTNLNGVATVITTALSGSQVCVWNGSYFSILSGTTGAGIAASGNITLTGNPVANDTVTVGGTVVTFVASNPSGSQVLIGANANATAANLEAFLAASVDTNIAKCTYSLATNVITITFKTVGTTGNSFTLARSSSNITVSGADLSGGLVGSSVGYATSPASGTDISAMLGLTSALAQSLVPGYAAESPAQCASSLMTASNVWYGLQFATTNNITDNQFLAVAALIEATGSGVARVFGVTTQETNALSSASSNDLGASLQALGYTRSFCQYSSTNPYAVASFFGRAFTVDWEGSNTTINLMWKVEPGIVAETLTEAQAATLKAKNINVFVNYVNGTAILQYGTMASGLFFDLRQGVDWVQNAVQTALYNVLYTSLTKVPQTDAGVTQLTNAIAQVANQAVTNGLVAPGIWNAAGFGGLQEGQYMKLGYYIFAPSVALQSQADRAARKSPSIQVALKLAGAINTVNVAISVNQ